MKNRVVSVRLNAAEHEALLLAAKVQKTTASDLLRAYMNEGLSGFDRRHESLLELLRGVQSDLRQIKGFSATAVGAVALLNIPRHDEAQILDVRKNLDQSFGLEPAMDKLMGQFQKKTMKGS